MKSKIYNNSRSNIRQMRNIIREYVSIYSSEIDYSKNPDKYKKSRGSQGVYTVSPYKDILLPMFKFDTPSNASRSAKLIFDKYLDYRKDNDYIGMDMARKYLVLGKKMSQRFYKNAGGKKNQKRGGRKKLKISKLFDDYIDIVREM